MAQRKLTDADILEPLPDLAIPAVQNQRFDLGAQKQFLSDRLEYVLSLELTEDNIERVKTLKKAIVSWRTKFTKEADMYDKANFTAQRNIFKALVEEVLADIREMEGKADEVLAKEEEKRIAGIDVIIDGIVADLAEEFNLTEEDAAKIERKKNFYNKTADLKSVADNLREQAANIVQAKKTREIEVKLIANLCSTRAELNQQVYLEMLAYMPVAAILEKIGAEITRLENLSSQKIVADILGDEDEQDTEEYDDMYEAAEAQEPITVGIPVDKNSFLPVDFPGRTKTMDIRIEYPAEHSDALSNLFNVVLKRYGITIKVLPSRI